MEPSKPLATQSESTAEQSNTAKNPPPKPPFSPKTPPKSYDPEDDSQYQSTIPFSTRTFAKNYQEMIDRQVMGQEDKGNSQADNEAGQAASERAFGSGEISQSQKDVDGPEGSRDVLRIIPTNPKRS